MIEILRKSNKLRDIGIRDCVYVIYSTHDKQMMKIYLRACYCNTYILMLNKLLKQHKLPSIKIGIGLATSKTLVIKAGRKYVGINDKIWIGNSVIDASNFSAIANTGNFGAIVMSPNFYKYILEYEEDIHEDIIKKDSKYGECYSANIIITDFEEWIN